jgi:hypothetical protein
MKYLTDAASVLSYFLYEGKVRLIQKSSKIFFSICLNTMKEPVELYKNLFQVLPIIWYV